MIATAPHSALTSHKAPTTKSSLSAPIIRMSGHSAEVFSVRFSPNGKHLATSAMDRSILLWNVGGESNNWGALMGHKNAVLDLKWTSDGQHLVSASADKHMFLWDVETTTRVRKFTGHTAPVSQVQLCNETLVLTGSDDGTVYVWDTRSKHPVDHMLYKLPICALAVTQGGDTAFFGSVDNCICAYDMRAKSHLYTLEGHSDTVNGLALDPHNFRLLSVSVASGSAKVWDVKPFSPIAGRCITTLDGLAPSPSNINMQVGWSPSGIQCASGSMGDSSVVVWDVHFNKIKYKLPGHRGGVTSVDFHPTEPVVASGGIDSVVFVGELEDYS